MKMAFSTLGCPGWSWDEIFATAKDLGLDGIEVRGVGNEMFAPAIKVFSSGNLAATRGRLLSAGIEIPMLTSGACLGIPGEEARTKAMEEAKSYIDLASMIGASYVRVIITASPAPTENEDLLQAKGLYLQLCAYAAGKNVTVLIETNGTLAKSSTMRSFMQDVDPKTGGVLWDLHHPYRFFGETPEQTYKNIGNWIRYVHVKDSAMQGDKLCYRMMGYGDVPVLDALRLLDGNGYAGYVTLEWVKRWNPDLQEPGIVFAHFVSYMGFLKNQLK